MSKANHAKLTVHLLAATGLLASVAAEARQGPPARAAPAVPADWAHPSGPDQVQMSEDAALPGHTIYHPADLTRATGHGRLPIVVFAGPGCDFDGTAFRPFFTEIASHGFLVVASGPPQQTDPGVREPKTKPADLTASIDWALAQNVRRGSAYRGKLDPRHVAVMGQSCGGLQALSIIGDRRISTVVLWNSGILNQPLTQSPGAPPLPAGALSMPIGSDKSALAAVHVPIAYFVGRTDVASPNAQDDFSRLNTVPAFLGILDIPGDAHAGTFRQPNGGAFGAAGVAWLRWRLKGDQQAVGLFRGAACGLCSDPRWTIRKKGIDSPSAGRAASPAP